MEREQQRLQELFLQKIPSKILMELKNMNTQSYASQLSKSIDCTYSHTVKVLEQMHELGLISFRRQGRIKVVYLTQRGQNIAEKVEHLVKSFQLSESLIER